MFPVSRARPLVQTAQGSRGAEEQERKTRQPTGRRDWEKNGRGSLVVGLSVTPCRSRCPPPVAPSGEGRRRGRDRHRTSRDAGPAPEPYTHQYRLSPPPPQGKYSIPHNAVGLGLISAIGEDPGVI